MNTSAIITLSAVGTLAVAGAGVGAWQLIDGGQKYADVVKVEAASRDWQEPVENCQQVSVQRQKPVRDEHRLTGTAIGAVVGGVVGNQFGGGSGKDAATAAGAIAGGYAGNKTQQRMQEGSTYTTTEERCQTLMENRSEPAGYDVTYRLDGETHTVRMQQKPGDRLPVDDGQVVTD